MLYYLVRPVARFVLSFYLKHIVVDGLEHIPAKGPVILAANHPTAFIEPCLLACFQRRDLHFLARGDLFKSWWAKLLLRGLHILPVYRLKDGGYGKLTDNYATFEACHEVLSGGGAVMILAEGRCIHEKRLRPLRKGTARIALGALAADPTLKDIPIVPVGVNFVAAERLRTTVMMRCGRPLHARDYLESYLENEAVAIRELTGDLRGALSPLVIQFPDPALNDRYERHLEKVRAGLPNPSLDAELDAVAGFDGKTDRFGRLWPPGPQRGSKPAKACGYTGSKKAPLYREVMALFLLLPQLPVWVVAQVIAWRGPKTIEFYSPVRFAALAVGMMVYVPVMLLWWAWWGKVWLVVSLGMTGKVLEVFEPRITRCSWFLRGFTRI